MAIGDENTGQTAKRAVQKIVISLAVAAGMIAPAAAQQNAGPLLPHVGAQIDYAFSNKFGPDAEARVTFTAVTDQVLGVDYSSTRGLRVSRDIRMSDREFAKSYVLGYSARMPRVIPQSTSLGISGATLLELRNTGRTPLRLIYDEKLSAIDGELLLVEKDIKLPIILEDKLQETRVVHATGRFGTGKNTATGDFYFIDNKANPMLVQSTIRLSWEKEPRTERIVRAAASASMKSAMEQSLATVRKYDLYGIHFDFDKASIRPESAQLIKDIALTLKNNPTWTLQINGHTDSIGKPEYNLKLSAGRATSVAKAIAREGIDPKRLMTGGFGETQPKGDNQTLQGRALNRRVELLRTDK